MARNGSGTYAKVNTFVSGNSITAAGHNQNWDDLVTEMTNSVAADGQTTMTGPLKLANGTAAAPGLTFASDTNHGIYRIGADNMGFTLAGSKVGDWSATGLSITGTLTSSGALTVSGGGAAVTGNSTVTGTLGVSSDFAVNTSKFTVTGASGNTAVAGTLGVTSDLAVNTSKFTVTASSGNTAVAGTLGVTGDFAVNTSKFTVAASSGNTVVAGTLSVTGATTYSGALKSSSSSGGVGYATGAGGTVTQLTDWTTGVTINTVTGTITLATDSMAAGVQKNFTVTNSSVAATDLIVVNLKSGGPSDLRTFLYWISAVGAGSFNVNLYNSTAGVSTGSVTPVLSFAVIKGVAS